LKRVLEVGGGRDPAFGTSAPAEGLQLIVNDIDPRELALLPPGMENACFDIAGDLSARPELKGTCDMLVSRMVFEHVHDVEAAWKNAYSLLRPGGVAMAFFPTLYSWPFVINKLLPGDIAKKLVQTFTTQDRSDEGDNPVFPPVYSWCYGSETKLRTMLEPIGYSEIAVLPFWGHRYLDRIPVAREIDHAFNKACAKADIRAMTTYAYVILRK
jgi:SAM-dependent methyltransferase